jgi:hypothetical protein
MTALGMGTSRAVEEVISWPGLFTRGVNTIFGGAQGIFNILDTGSSIARGAVDVGTDLLRGEDVSIQEFLNPITSIWNVEDRISGSELLYGEDAADKFTWSGLAAEIILDPLTYATFGLTGAGKLAARAGKLGPAAQAQKSMATSGSKRAATALESTTKALDEVIAKQSELGRKAGETLEKSIAEQFKSGQRGFQIGLPFAKPLIETGGANLVGLGAGFDAVRHAATHNPLAKTVQKGFRATKSDPLQEALRIEQRRERRWYINQARDAGRDLLRKRVLLEAKDPDVSFKIIKVLEEAGDALAIPEDITVDALRRMPGIDKLIKTRLSVEQYFSETDNFADVWAFARQLRQMNDETLRAERLAGVAVDPLDSMFGYVARVLTPEGRDLLRGSKGGRKQIQKFFDEYDTGPTLGFQRARSFRDLNLEDLNAKLAKMYGKDPDKFKFFDTDIVSVQVNRMMASGRQISRARFAQGVVDLFADGVEAAKGKMDQYVPIEKFMSPRSGLVINYRFLVDYDADALVEHLSRQNELWAESGKTAGSIKVGSHPINRDVTPDVVRQMIRYRTPAAFSDLSEGHAWLNDRWAKLVKNGALTEDQVAALRVFYAQVPADKLKNLSIEPMSPEISDILRQAHGSEGLWMGYFRKGDPGDPDKLRLLAGRESPRKVSQADRDLLKFHGVKPGDRPGGAYRTFLHEYAHFYHMSLLDKETKEIVDQALQELSRDLKLSRTLVDGNLRKMGMSPTAQSLMGDPASRNLFRNDRELFADLFVSWALGERIGGEALEKVFKRSYNEMKRMRDNILDSGRLIDPDTGKVRPVPDNVQGRYSTQVDEIIGERNLRVIHNIFDGVTASNAEIINNLGPGARKSFIADLMSEAYTRRDYLTLPKNASRSQIRRALIDRGVKQRYLPREAMEFAEEVLGRTRFHLDSNEWWAKTIRVLDEVHGLFRTALTQYFPAFHSRNYISNAFMNAMAGVVNPAWYFRAHTELRKLAKDPERALYLSSLGVLDDGKIREVFDYMTQTQGSISRRLGRGIDAIPHGGQIATKGHRATLAAGYAVENNTRLAHFLAKKAEGLSDTEAADSVLKYLFDYQDLTDFERAVPRRAMLFYTFFRKNLPLMLEQSFRNPRFMLLYGRATGQTNVNITQPEWLPDSFFFGQDEKGRTVRLNFGLPPEDLARFDPEGRGLARVFEILISNMAPAIREPFQFVSGKDLFTGQPLEGGVVERVGAFLPTARATGTAERFVKAAKGDDPNLSLGAETMRYITGIAKRPIDEQAQAMMNQLGQIRHRLDEIVREGGGRKFEIVGNRRDRENPEIKMLNSMASKIQNDLRKLREGQAN